MALATERGRLGPMVTPLPRRRPWKLARESVTLDRLSGGRLVLGVGLGEPRGRVRQLRRGRARRSTSPWAGPPPDDPAAARAMLEPLAEAGVTWWQETVDPRETELATFTRRVRQGPPGG